MYFTLTLDKLVVLIILLWTFIYTASYARWTWNKKNRLGAFMLMLLASAVLILPIYTLLFRY